MYQIHSIETYAVWTMKQQEKRVNESAKTDKTKFHYAYALGYACKAMGIRHRDDSIAHDIAQSAFLLWHKSQTGKRIRLDTRAAVRYAVRNYWRNEHQTKGETSEAINPNSKYAYPTISTARKNNMSNVQTSEGIPDRMTRNLDLQFIDMEATDTTITTVIRLLSTGASQRDVSKATSLSEMQVSRIIARLRDMGKEYWGMRERGKEIPQAPLATIPYRAPKTYKPIVVATNAVQTVLDHKPIRISEQRYSAQWREYAETFRNATDTSLRENVDNYGYTENDMANPMPNDNDSAFKGEIIYS